MKTLSIRQPWASLVCSGVKDVENRSWCTNEPPGRILVHAGGKKVPKNFDSDYLLPEEKSFVNNLKQFGIIPEYEDMPLSAIIGYVDVTGFATDSKSMWAGEGDIHWLLENAHIFDKPICNVQGKLGIFDYPIDENKLPPAHKMDVIFPVIKGKKLTVHVGDKDWKNLKKSPAEYYIDINNKYICDCICNEYTEPRKVSNIEFVHGKETMEFMVTECDWDSIDFILYAVYRLGKRLK